MPDDERTRRRLGDETKARIADLSSGWSVESDAPPEKTGATTPPPRGDETQERINDLASGWSVDPELSAVPLAPPLGRRTPSPEDAIRPVTRPSTRIPVPAITPPSGPTASPTTPPASGRPKSPTMKPAIGTPPAGRTAAPTTPPIGTPPAARPVTRSTPPVGTSPAARTTSPTNPGIPDAPSPRPKQKTLPPPPPGSEARRQLETAILDAKDATPVPVNPARATRPPPVAPPTRGAKPTSPPPLPPRAKQPTLPPLPPGARAKQPTLPPLPPGARVKQPTLPPLPPPPSTITTNAVAGTIGGETGVILLGDAVGSKTGVAIEPTGPNRDDETDADSKLTVPVGEFDDSSTFLEKDKLQIAHAQSTIKRDAASALLGIAEPHLTQVKPPPVEMLLTETAEALRDDATSVDPSTVRFERGDPTNLGDNNNAAANAMSRVHTKAGRLRTVAALRRQRGIFGDVRYVATAVFGVRHARRELEELEAKQVARQLERRKHMLILGRTAVVSDGFDHPAIGPARDQLGGVEDERARHRGQVVAADSELERVTRDRQSHAMQFSTDLASINGELAELTKRLEPLLKEQIQVTKRGAELRDQLRRIDAKIQETTASLVSVKGPKQDPAGIQAELATLKADRVAVQRDEPKIASELDALNPRIAAIEAKRTESQKRHADITKAEEDDKRRTEELLSAIGAKRKVMDRAAGDAETLRDKILFELGERLYVDRPDDLGPQLAPVDAIDLELGTHDRRVMELREILSSIDKAKLARGILVIVLVLGVIGVMAGWLIYTLG